MLRYTQKNKLSRRTSVDVCAGSNVRYVCPQKIVIDENDDVTLFFRALSPGKEVEISVETGGNNIYRRKAIAVNPGEIESVLIKKTDMAKLSSPVTVNVMGNAE